MMPVTDQMHRTVVVPEAPQRIISLVPSQTELLHDLGLGERVVGITRFCVHPEAWFKTKPRVGGTKKVDFDKVRALKPDLIIGNKEENERADIEALEREFPVWMSDIRKLEEALKMIQHVGELTGTTERARVLNAGITEAFDTLQPLRPERSAAYLIWREPLMVAGGDTFIGDMMRRSGLVNIFMDRTDRYAVVDPGELAEADPDVILLSSEPYPFSEKHLAEFNMSCPGTPVRLVDGELFSWYGSRLWKTPRYLQGLIAELSAGHPA
ncbi:MAG TPA: helical backbone metal receptor [Flavobacteriales bacterium]|nr:helical backbone metal receptor [Flavobacteriales bacterium]HNE80781.1 helical backbone metal receptor [Flavobacteriales bacterium]HNI04321.1 helical backbone metal receptor [Flavobacteriales bacterium]HNK41218.1 helical backbone metal receptor [Flavobacteriales bacterium]HNK68058.1 helical backbone metal receptor [Flavobacteriales bacterium]